MKVFWNTISFRLCFYSIFDINHKIGFSDLKLRKQLGIAFGIAIWPLLAMSLIPIIKLGSVNNTAQELAAKYVPMLQYAYDMHNNISNTVNAFQMFAAEKCAISAKSIDEVSTVGVDVANQTGDVFSKVLPEIEKTTLLVQEIAVMSKEQASGGAQINDAVQRFNTGIQQVATISEEVASNSSNLIQQAEKLQDIIKFFKI